MSKEELEKMRKEGKKIIGQQQIVGLKLEGVYDEKDSNAVKYKKIMEATKKLAEQQKLKEKK